MKNVLTILLILLAANFSAAEASYDMMTPVTGSTIADETLQYNVMKTLYKIYAGKYPTCTDFSIKNTQVLHYPYDVKKKKGKYVKGYWKEMWTVDACGLPLQFPVTFFINRNGATFYIDKKLLND